MTRLSGRHDPPFCPYHCLGTRTRRFFENAAHGRNTQMETCATEHLGDLHLAHTGTQYLETLYCLAYEIREPIHWLVKPQECIVTFFVDTLHPGANRGSGHEEGFSRLCR